MVVNALRSLEALPFISHIINAMGTNIFFNFAFTFFEVSVLVRLESLITK